MFSGCRFPMASLPAFATSFCQDSLVTKIQLDRRKELDQSIPEVLFNESEKSRTSAGASSINKDRPYAIEPSKPLSGAKEHLYPASLIRGTRLEAPLRQPMVWEV